jgi:CHAD domain-containing protein
MSLHWGMARKAHTPTLQPVPVNRDASVQERIRAGLDTHLHAMLAREAGTRLGEDPEELHQMRVAVRRLRALFKTGRPFLDDHWSQPLQAELGWLGGVLGEVRDLDVLLERLRHEAAGLDDQEHRAFERLISGLERDHAQHRQDLLAALDTDRYADLVGRLVSAVQSPLPTQGSYMDGQAALHHIISTQFRKLRKAVTRAGTQATDSQLHALRIQGKRLRYAAELAGSADQRMRRLVAACKQFQDVLGEHQDACVAQARVRQLLADLGPEADTSVAFVAGRLVEREAMRRSTCRDQWWSRWQGLSERAGKIAA